MSKDYVELEGELISSTETNEQTTPSEQPSENPGTSSEQPSENHETPSTDQNQVNSSETPNKNSEESEKPINHEEEVSMLGTKITLEKDIDLRSLPNFASRSISRMAKGVQLDVVGELNKWIKITDGNITGWTLKANNPDVNNPEVSTPDTNNPETSNPNTNSPETSNPDTNSPETSNPDSNKPEDNNPGDNPTSVLKTGYINSARVNIRKSPKGKEVDVALKNDKVEILGEDGDWYKVNVEGRESGYVAKRLVTIND